MKRRSGGCGKSASQGETKGLGKPGFFLPFAELRFGGATVPRPRQLENPGRLS